MSKLRVSYGRTLQTAPYESLRLEVALEEDIGGNALNDTEIVKAMDAMTDKLANFVKAKAAQIIEKER